MRRLLSWSCVVACASAVVWLESVAEEPPVTVEAVKAQVEELDRRLEKLRDEVNELGARQETLKKSVSERIDALKALAKQPAELGEEGQRRIERMQTGNETAQLEALAGAEKLGDVGLILIGYAARESAHESVRHKALALAAGLKEKGLPPLAFAFERLDEKDQVFAVEELAKHPTDHHVILLARALKDGGPKVREAVLTAARKLDQRTLFFAAVGKGLPDQVGRLIDAAAEIEGDDGLLLLYAAARKGEPPHRVAALQAAAKRGAAAWPVVAAAYRSESPEVRGEVVRTARKLGGPVGNFVVDEALKDRDEGLRAAAEKARE